MHASNSTLRRWVAASAVLGLIPGCAQVITRSSVEVVPRDGAALVVGPPGGEVTARSVEADWTQDGDRLTVRIEESRTCNSVRHTPVTRIERVDRRTARGAMWFEYGFGAAALAAGLTGLIRPEWFSQATVTTEDGRVLEDKKTGYRIGGILTGIGSLLLVAAMIDTVRTRDQVFYADAYRREEGDVVQCMDPLVPMDGQTVELLVGKWSTVEGTDDGGGARFLLPSVEDLPEEARKVIAATAAWDAAKAEADAAAAKAAEEAEAKAKAEAEAAAKKGRKGKAGAGKKTAAATGAAGTGASGETASGGAAGDAAMPAAELGPRPEPMVVKGVLRLDAKRALAVSFVVPYEADTAKGYEGRGALDSGPKGGPAPGKPKGADTSKDDAAAKEADDAKGNDTSDTAEDRPSAKGSGDTKSTTTGSEASKTGEGSLRLGGSGASKTGEGTLTLGGSGTKKTGTPKPDEGQ